MKQFCKFLILFCALSTSFGARYECKSGKRNPDVCRISSLDLTQGNFEIEIIGNNLASWKKFQLKKSFIRILPKGICESLPNLEEININRQSIVAIMEDAFQHCKNVKLINLNNNMFWDVHRNTFKGLKNLERIYICHNNIQVLDLDLSDCKNITTLGLTRLKISHFPVEMIRELQNLEYLYLHPNSNLRDIDIESIVEFCPNLKRITLPYNKFKCTRRLEIISILKEKQIDSNEQMQGCVSHQITTSNNKIDTIPKDLWEKYRDLFEEFTEKKQKIENKPKSNLPFIKCFEKRKGNKVVTFAQDLKKSNLLLDFFAQSSELAFRKSKNL